MVFIFFFDGTFIVVAAAMLVFFFAGLLEQVFPVISVILWIVFALSAGLNAFFVLVDPETPLPRKIINFIVCAIANVFIGMLLASYISSMNAAMSMGGLNGLLEFILEAIFGSCGLLFGGAFLGYAGFNVVDMDGEATLPYGVRLAISVLILFLAAKFVL